MNGLILAGGDGSRLLASGIARPKALIEIAGQPQVVRLVDTFFGLGCESVTCAIRDDLNDEVGAVLAGTGARLVAVRTASSLHTLVAGLDEVPPGDVVCTMVDTVMPRADWRAAHGAAVGHLGVADAVVVVTPFVSDEAPLWVAVDEHGRVLAFDGDSERSVATGGVYWLGERARTVATIARDAGVMKMRGYLARLVETGHDVRAVAVTKIVDVDTREDLHEALALLGDDE